MAFGFLLQERVWQLNDDASAIARVCLVAACAAMSQVCQNCHCLFDNAV